MDKKFKYEKTASEPDKCDATLKKSAWINVGSKLKKIFPYIWPKSNLSMQFRTIICCSLLLSQRIVNVFVPMIHKDVIDILSLDNGAFPYQKILIYSGIKLLQGGTGAGRFGGIINCIKNVLWIKVNQNTVKRLKLDLFNHIHRLGIRWHYGRKIGEVLRVMDRGTSSVTTILDHAFFSLIPIFIDVIIAIAALSYDLNGYFGLIIFVTMLIYISVTVIGTEFRTKFKREMNQADNEQRSKSHDSILNSETVKLYGNEDYESSRFSHYMEEYQKKEWKSQVAMFGFNLLQTFTLNAGLMTGLLYCAYLISQHRLTVGDFALFATYMMQLMQPLNQLSMLYRNIQESLINMENMIELMDEKLEIEDLPDAPDFDAEKSDIVLDNVSFHYNYKQPILKGISLRVKEGSSLAVVGHSGSGKSTLIKLLLRLFDPTEGSVKIGGQDLRFIKQTSLRQNIGVVPQDTVLFNDTILHNIKYGKVGATDEEAMNATKTAEIHEQIVQNFPDSYDTKVGERGMKLSGGEKQRVALARTLLRSPKLILLDEATSSLDNTTEKNIQIALDEECKNRTRVIVAHRLTTIQTADHIIVLDNGVIAEQGNHSDLLKLDKLYAKMWKNPDQLSDNQS